MACRANTEFTNPPHYIFACNRLRKILQDPSKQPVVLIACGSFSPVSDLHLKMFEMAMDHARRNTNFEIMGGYLSPVGDQYSKPGLLSAIHRVNMCTLAAEETSSWLMADRWEAFQKHWQPTSVALDHFDYEINTILGGVHTQDGAKRDVRVMLLAGSDLITTMSQPNLWTAEELDHILGRYGMFVIERAGSSMDQATDYLARWLNNIVLIPQLVQNDISSTKARLFLRRGPATRYQLPTPVARYIEENNLFLDDGCVPEGGKGEDKDSSSCKQD